MPIRNFQRPNFPYTPLSLQNYDRIETVTNTTRKPYPSKYLDWEFDYIIECIRINNEDMQDIAANILPGVNDPNNYNKLPTPDRNGGIAFVKITGDYVDAGSLPGTLFTDQSFTTNLYAKRSVTSDVIGIQEVKQNNIALDSIGSQQLIDGGILGSKLAPLCVDNSKVANVSGNKILAKSIPASAYVDASIPTTAYGNESIPTTAYAPNSVDINALAQAVINMLVPLGNISYLPYLPTDLPSFMIPQGQDLSRTTYAPLFGKIGTQYGSASSTTFKLPNLPGRMLIATSSTGTTNGLVTAATAPGGTTVGKTFGAETQTLTIDQMPKHTHSIYYYNILSTNQGGGVYRVIGDPNFNNGLKTDSIINNGGDQPHNNMPPSMFMYPIMRVL